MAADSGDGLPISPSEKSLTGSLASDENEKSVSRSPSGYSIREDKWPDLVVSRPRKLDAWWLPRREYTARWLHGPATRRAFQKSGARGLSFGARVLSARGRNSARTCRFAIAVIFPVDDRPMSAGDVIKTITDSTCPNNYVIALDISVSRVTLLLLGLQRQRSFFIRSHMRLLIFVLEKRDMTFIISSYIFL